VSTSVWSVIFEMSSGKGKKRTATEPPTTSKPSAPTRARSKSGASVPSDGSPLTDTPSLSSPAENKLEAEVRSSQDQTANVEYLVKEVGFDEGLAVAFDLCGGAKELVSLLKSGFEFSESDPLLLLIPEMENADSVHYFNNGNCGLPRNIGGLQWPGGAGPPAAGAAVPAGVDAIPPHALGRFIAGQAGVEDKSHGKFVLFYVDNLENLHLLPGVVQGSTQFCRLGPAMARRLRVPTQTALLHVVTLDRMAGPPRLYSNFNQTA
jgi:hypothetical protein